MDPLSQAVTGATFAQFAKNATVRRAAFCGLVGGVFPDLDILIRSDSDPLLALEYHRHFTHSLFFIPMIGLFVSWLLSLTIYRRGVPFYSILIPTTLGVATHGLLDSFTTYGTYLYWPLSHTREAFNLISIIDPLYTLPLLLLLITAAIIKKRAVALAGVVWAVVYLSFNAYQQHIVTGHLTEIAASRGHQPQDMMVSPSIFNNIVWRTIYRHGDRYYVDAIRHVPGQGTHHFPGSDVAVYQPSADIAALPEASQQRRDIERFRRFTNDYLYTPEGQPNYIADLRYSRLPHSIVPMWGIRVLPDTPEAHVDFIRFNQGSPSDRAILKKMLSQR